MRVTITPQPAPQRTAEGFTRDQAAAWISAQLGQRSGLAHIAITAGIAAALQATAEGKTATIETRNGQRWTLTASKVKRHMTWCPCTVTRWHVKPAQRAYTAADFDRDFPIPDDVCNPACDDTGCSPRTHSQRYSAPLSYAGEFPGSW